MKEYPIPLYWIKVVPESNPDADEKWIAPQSKLSPVIEATGMKSLLKWTSTFLLDTS